MTMTHMFGREANSSPCLGSREFAVDAPHTIWDRPDLLDVARSAHRPSVVVVAVNFALGTASFLDRSIWLLANRGRGLGWLGWLGWLGGNGNSRFAGSFAGTGSGGEFRIITGT